MSFERYVHQPEPNRKIWRYTTFARFVSLLERGSLFFPQIRILQDRYEGYFPAPPKSDLQKELKRQRDMPNSPYSYGVVSCWSLDDQESEPMWKSYAGGNEGVAIQSTVDRLNTSLDCSLFFNTFTGKVEYRDPPEPTIEPGSIGAPFQVNVFYKRTAFKAENEYRVLGFVRNFKHLGELGGLYVPVNLLTLIDCVYIAPKAGEWFQELLESLLSRYSVSASVICSSLDNDPYA